tara:strand:+ start:339 stop:584 length:246 start_codon:yes stop_codon:yes gene_type:complete
MTWFDVLKRKSGRRGKKARKKRKKGKSKVNQAGNYTKPTMRKKQFARIKAGSKGGPAGKWSARKAQLLARRYEKAGGGYRD